MYSVDWAIKKKFQIYNTDTEKLKSISPTREAYDKFFDSLSNQHAFYIEEGGGDTFKLLALNHGHKVFTISRKELNLGGKCIMISRYTTKRNILIGDL